MVRRKFSLAKRKPHFGLNELWITGQDNLCSFAYGFS